MSKFLDKLFSYLGYEKAQVKPNAYPLNNKIPEHSYEKDKVLNPEEIQQDLSQNGPISTSPEQLSGNPQILTPEQDIRRHQEEARPDFKPYNELQDVTQNNSGIPTNTLNINEKNIKPRPVLDVEEISKLNRNIAQKMKQLGVLTVDKELFMEAYSKWYTSAAIIAAKRKIPISEVFDELL